jgi:hypothetical protein
MNQSNKEDGGGAEPKSSAMVNQTMFADPSRRPAGARGRRGENLVEVR